MTEPAKTELSRTALIVVACGALILMVAMGVRQTMGLLMPPMTLANDFSRETFSFAIAIQNLMWGAAVPFTGAIADRFGSARVLFVGATLYALGLVLMAHSGTATTLNLSAGLMIGLAFSGTTFAVVMGVIARAVPPEKRSLALGIAGAGGSFGQFAMVPIGQGMIVSLGWYQALFALAAVSALIVPIAWWMVKHYTPFQSSASRAADASTQTVRAALGEALGERSFHFLFWSYFVCGVHTTFIGLHLPSYVIDKGFSITVGMTALALIGFGNIFGSYGAGWLGGVFSKKWLLTAIYALRALIIFVFISLPISPTSLYIFAFCMGFLWLSTVPLTNALVAQIYGLKHVSMLSGTVFFGHQIGSFAGAWLGGRIFDTTQSYDWAWWISIALGLAAALVCMPIRETALDRKPALA